jgi:hypothetical protein
MNFSFHKMPLNLYARPVVLASIIALVLLCLPYLTNITSRREWFSSEASSPFRGFGVIDKSALTDDFAASIPFDAFLPKNATASHLTVNPNVDRWLANALSEDLNKVRDHVSLLGGEFDSRGYEPLLSAVLVGADSRIRAMSSNARLLYFGSGALPMASTGKIFVALALGKHDRPTDQYCSPQRITSWPAVDAAMSPRCEANGLIVSARVAFARSLPEPILWRSFQTISEAELRNVFQQLGITDLNYPSVRAGAILGSIKVPPVYLHRAALAITLAFAGRTEPAKTPTLIDSVSVRNADGTIQEQHLLRGAVSSSNYSSVLDNDVLPYASAILAAPIWQGTLHELAKFTARREITSLWGKTGTFAVNGHTRHIWIVGGLIVNGNPYSYLVLAAAPDHNHSFGNANASVFAPIASDLIEAAIRDSQPKEIEQR